MNTRKFKEALETFRNAFEAFQNDSKNGIVNEEVIETFEKDFRNAIKKLNCSETAKKKLNDFEIANHDTSNKFIFLFKDNILGLKKICNDLNKLLGHDYDSPIEHCNTENNQFMLNFSKAQLGGYKKTYY